MKPTGGRKPRTGDRELRVKYRNGLVDNFPRKASQMRWTDTGYDWDIVECEFWDHELRGRT